MRKQIYAIAGSGTAIGALLIDQLLWVVTNLAFGPGVLLGLASPVMFASIGTVVGIYAKTEHGATFGYSLIAANVLAALLGLLWALIIQPRAFATNPVPV